MKKILKITSLLIFSVLVLASCLKTEETETTPECAITAFSIGDITSKVTIKNYLGNDTVVSRVLKGSTFYFNIDQLNGEIYSIDSVANWVDLTKVCPTFTSKGYVFGRNESDGLYYQMTSGSDSINLEKPIDIRVMSTDGLSTKHYTLTIHKSNYELDTLIWNKQTNDFKVKDDFKVLTLNNRMFAFAKGNEGTQLTSASVKNNLTTWTTPANIQGGEIDYSSVTLFNDEFYALGTDGCIYKAQDNTNPDTWNKVGEKTLKSILASDKYYLYATDGKEILCSADLQTWKSCGDKDIDKLPSTCINSYSYESKTNSNIYINTLCGITDEKKAVAWYKVTSLDENINQDWSYIQITNDNTFTLPDLKDLSVAVYNGSMYAIGIEEDNSKDTYKCIYRSDDNGITWHELEEKYLLPTDLDAANGTAKIINVDNNLWIIQKGGNIWSGVIR